MSSLTLRRVIVWVVSIIAGVLATLLIFAIIGTDVAEFGIETIFVIIPLALAVLIWLDYFLSAEILPD